MIFENFMRFEVNRMVSVLGHGTRVRWNGFGVDVVLIVILSIKYCSV